MPGLFHKFEETSRERPDQWERAKALRSVVEKKLGELAQTVSLRRTQGLEPAREIVETDRGKNLMDDIRAKCAVINDIAARRILDFTAQAEASNTFAAFTQAAVRARNSSHAAQVFESGSTSSARTCTLRIPAKKIAHSDLMSIKIGASFRWAVPC